MGSVGPLEGSCPRARKGTSGKVLGGDEAALYEHADHFATRMNDLSTAITVLQECSSKQVERNLRTLGFEPGSETGLGHYLSAARARPMHKQTAYAELCVYFESVE